MNIRNEIHIFLKRWELTQTELAALAGVRQPSISMLIRGKTKDMRSESADRIRKVMAEYEATHVLPTCSGQ